VEGVVKGKVTLVAATPDDSGTAPQIYLSGNITYTTSNGTDGFTAIAEDDVLIPLNSPDTMEIHGTFVAQGGHFGRNYYDAGDVPAAYTSYAKRSLLTTAGSIVSLTRTGTKWMDGSGTYVSGYATRVDAYDQLQAVNPPPFTPSASTDYSFVLWREQ